MGNIKVVDEHEHQIDVDTFATGGGILEPNTRELAYCTICGELIEQDEPDFTDLDLVEECL